MAVNAGVAGTRWLISAQYPQSGGFPGPIWAQKTKDFTLSDHETQVVDRCMRAETL
jgi:hypothetical protein